VAPAVPKRRRPTPPGGPANAAGGSKRAAGVHQRARARSLDRRDEYVHHYLEYALVADSSPVSKYTRMEDRESVHAHLCVHDNDFAACIRCKGKKRAGHQTPWLLDSGASKHFTNNLDDYVDYSAWSPSEQKSLTTATSTAKILGEGTVIIRVPDLNGNYRAVRIRGIRYVPNMNTRLLSLGTFLQEGMNIRGDEQRLVLEKKGKPFMVFQPSGPRDTLFGVNSETFSEDVAQALKTVHNVDYDIVHQRFAHPSDEVLKRARSKTIGFPDVVFNRTGICPGCALGKMANRPYPVNEKRASRALEMIHSDLKSYPIRSVHGYKYVVTFFDDHSSHAWHQLIKTKDETLRATRQFIKMVKNQFDSSIKRWRCDQGGEYMSHAYKVLLADEGILLIPSPPYTAQVNGRAERFMRTFSEKESAMRQLAGLPDSWWEFSVEHGIHVYNRTPLKRLKWITPYEVIHGAKPDITHLCTLGCEAYVFRHEDTRANKLAPKSVACTYVGWGDSGHRFMAKTGKFIQSAHAIFDETVFPRTKDARPTAKSRKVTEQSVTLLPDAFDSPDIYVGGGGYIPPVQSADSDAGPDEEPPVSLPAPEGTSPKSLRVRRTNVSRASLISRISSGSNIRWNLGPSVSDPEASDADEPSVPSAPVAPKVPASPTAAVEPRRGGRVRNC
jgi:hypothetical protein